MSLNKYCQSSSSSSSSSSIRDKKVFSKLKLGLTGDYPKKSAELLSAQYGINLLLVGVALMLAIARHDSFVKEKDLLSFTTGLMIVQLLWMLWYIVMRHSQRKKQTQRDVTATTCWIRGGLTLLAVLSLIMDTLKIGYFVGFWSCLSPVFVVYPVIHAIHTVAQVHFVWFYIKDVIKSFETFGRFGVIHAVFTNLLLWCSSVMSETEHFMSNHMRRIFALEFENITEGPGAPLPGPFCTLQPPLPSLATPRLTLDIFIPRLLSPKGAAITVTDTPKPAVGGFSRSSSYPANCEGGCTLTVPLLIKRCSSTVVASRGLGVGVGGGGTRQGFVKV
ncbi:Proton channel otop1 [Ilyodon furcidens]|uniref:Proton channel otop1 n=1 Tax=Ilyodon furcidens TaxID=33524 RepID=A0ABV0UUI7_9TELE